MTTATTTTTRTRERKVPGIPKACESFRSRGRAIWSVQVEQIYRRGRQQFREIGPNIIFKKSRRNTRISSAYLLARHRYRWTGVYRMFQSAECILSITKIRGKIDKNESTLKDKRSIITQQLKIENWKWIKVYYR